MTAKMHRMHFPNVGEGVLSIPGGVPYEVVPVSEALTRYAPGSYVRIGNKEFIYAIAGGDIIPDMGAMNSYKQKVVRAHNAAEVAAGSLVVGITPDSDSGLAWSEGVAKDELKGGQFIGFPTGNKAIMRGIVSNTMIPAGSGTIYITLDSPTPVILQYDKWCEAIRNPYGAVKQNQGAYAMVMGIPTVVATVGQGVWLQVGGPGWVAMAADLGSEANNQEAVFVGNGSIALRSETGNEDCQHAGVCIALASGEKGSLMLMLQIAH